MAVYLIEGLDGVGKSTLAGALAERSNGVTFHVNDGPNHNDWIDDYLVARTIKLCAPTRNVYLDRSLISGLVYGFEGPYEEALAIFSGYLREFGNIPVQLIHLTAPLGVRKERDPDGIRVPTRFAMEQFITDIRHWVPTLVFDTSIASTDLIADHILAADVEHELVMTVYANDWVKLWWPRKSIPQSDWVAAFNELKAKWGIAGRLNRHPYGYWMIQPEVIQERKGDLKQMAQEVVDVYQLFGYQVAPRFRYYTHRSFDEADVLI